MIEFDGITIPSGIQTCRNVYLYADGEKWILSTRAHKIAIFDNREDGEAWWQRFEEFRGVSHKPVKNSKPVAKVKNKKKANKRKGTTAGATTDSYGWSPEKGICPVCGGDGGAAGQCYKCGGSGWA
ncbi:hypothetical protein TspCOW1_27000 [Thiohalobacter sp. COW1]|nr:hypothetical protein TspCOW1_27000 [Thiohalobacter sp. COW1]